MNQLIFGKSGGGKGVWMSRLIEKELVSGWRDIVTNLTIMPDPWVNGRGRPQLGWREYLRHKYGEDFQCESRMKYDGDPAAQKFLFLWRRSGITGKWFKMDFVRNDKGKPDMFDPSIIQAENCRPILCITDEGWRVYPARGFSDTPPLVEFYMRQASRRLNDIWVVGTQAIKDVDVMIVRNMHEFYRTRNYGLETIFGFAAPKRFRVAKYGDMLLTQYIGEEWYKLPPGLCETYDESGGVNFAGGFVSDAMGSHANGIPWYYAAAVLLLAGILFWWGSTYLLHKVSGPVKIPVPLKQSGGFFSPIFSVSNPPARSGNFVGPVKKDSVRMEIFAPAGDGRWQVTLTDGRVFFNDSPNVHYFGRDSLIVGNEVFTWNGQN